MTDTAEPRPLSVYLVAGEESGDALGAALARALAARMGAAITLAGVGGRAMAAAGIKSPVSIEEIGSIGITTIIRRLPMILRRIRETADAIVAARPDVLVIIDSPDFTHRIARRVRAVAPAIPILDYVSPSVWAWRPGRARAMRDYIDCVLAILPFEPAAHQQLGGPSCVYVGHPLTERLSELRPNAEEARRRQTDPPLVLVLPGSRSSEIQRLLPVFGEAVALAAARIGPIDLVLPTLPHLAAKVRNGIAAWTIAPRIVVDPAEKWAAFRSARVALAASGTVTLELALSEVPTVAAYMVTRAEEFIMRRAGLHRRLTSVILSNLVVGENVVPEFLQQDCTPGRIADALVPLFSDSPLRRRQTEAFARLDQIMARDEAPSVTAAAIVIDVARRGRGADTTSR
jgi:lipid-A-disaccharide synthase